MSNKKQDGAKNKKKFFIQFAYPTVSGAMHVGHLRSYVPPDIQARYHRLKGEEVFFPLGFHATGIDSIVLFRKIKENPNAIEDYKIPVGEIGGIENVFQLEKLLERKITESMKTANLSLDYDTAVSTIDPHYNRFIEWQMGKLKEQGFLVKKPYRLPWCKRCDNPVALDAAGADIRVPEGVEEIRIVDYNMIKFRTEEAFLPIATLRPETIFGVTNLWFNPSAEYVECQAGEEKWILAKDSVKSIQDLGKKITILKTVEQKTLEELVAFNPLNGQEIPLVRADFVSPRDGTGVVMSVPAHDPHDYCYLIKERPDLEERILPVIDMDGETNPARTLINQMGGPENADLELVKKRLYRMENRGVMGKISGKYTGMNTEEARTQIKQELEMAGHLEVISELSAEVSCRCGERIIIKSLPNQWFVDYSNSSWKELARRCIKKMNIFPKEYKLELQETIISWLKERPLTRTTGLGTVFPYEPGLMIEALADSNIYMAFFPIAQRINRGEISAANLNDYFFDYVMLGKGETKETAKKTGVEPGLLEGIREEFNQTYPLDLNMGGMEHKQVHFPFYIFHHTAIFPEEKWPKGIIVNWHVVLEGKKMSKSEGHMVFWNDALKEYGVDGCRLYIAHGQSPFDNFDWTAEMAKKYSRHIQKFEHYVEKSLTYLGERIEEKNKEYSAIDRWLISRSHHLSKTVGKYLENAEVRWAVNEAFFTAQSDLKWYFQRGGNKKEQVEEFLKRQITILKPFIPETAEKLMKTYFFDASQKQTSWPEVEEDKINPETESLETMLMSLRNQLNSSLQHKKSRGKEGCSGIIIYTRTEKEKFLILDGLESLKNSTGIETVEVNYAEELKESDFPDNATYAKYSKPEQYKPKFRFLRQK